MIRIDLGNGFTQNIEALKSSFTNKEDFIAYVLGLKEAGLINKKVDPDKAWNKVKKYIEVVEIVVDEEAVIVEEKPKKRKKWKPRSRGK